MEATAQWAQQEAISGDTTYAAFIPNHLNESWRHMDTRNHLGDLPWGLPSDKSIAYSPLFPFYLIEKLNPGQTNKDIIRQTWEEYEQSGNCGHMKPVIDSVLPSNKSLIGLFPDYAEANYFLAYPSEQSTIQSKFGNTFRPVRIEHTLKDQTQSVTGPANNNPSYGGVSIEPLGAGYVEFHKGGFNGVIGRSLEITINIPANNFSTPPVVKVWTITQFPLAASSVPVAPTIPLSHSNGQYTATVTIPNFDSTQVQWVALEVTNPQTSGANLDNWSYQANIIAPTPTPTKTNTPLPTPTNTMTPTVTPSPQPTPPI